MKVHYINILLFAVPLNILVNTQKNPSITPTIPTTRLLCECELYAPANYDNDPQMKKVMENFDRQTSQKFHEYDERMKTTRQKCKVQCDKEIQKIILKDKINKELTEKFARLQTDIQRDTISTCVCEKSLSDKMEKECLRCGGVFGGGVAPSVGLLGGIGQVALSAWQIKAIASAKKAAVTEATKTATQEGMKAVISKINEFLSEFTGDLGLVDLKQIVNESTFNNGSALFQSAEKLINDYNSINGIKQTTSFQNTALTSPGQYYVGDFGEVGRSTFETEFALQKEALEAANLDTVNTTYAGCHNAIIASIVAVVVIVLIMVIIYLILRYRRKKKMKKKLQYIKLLEE
ncbi:PIR protein, putative [Plasmodium sp.]|nr:PIR protein, putative [Plasmodium sp.]